MYKITQLPLEEQISSLAAAGQYEEAIGLIDLLPKTKVVERTAMEIRLYKDFACDLFNEVRHAGWAVGACTVKGLYRREFY